MSPQERVNKFRKFVSDQMIDDVDAEFWDLLLAQVREAAADATFSAYDKARELVGFSPNACNSIESQMQKEFPERAFVSSQQMRSGGRMDGSNMRMPKSAKQIADEARAEEREACIEDAMKEFEQQMIVGSTEAHIRANTCDVIRKRIQERARTAGWPTFPSSPDQPPPTE